MSGERWQGIVPLEIVDRRCRRTLFRAVRTDTEPRPALRAARRGAGLRRRGLLLQHLPDGEVEGDRIEARADHPECRSRTIAATLKDEELTDAAASLETLAWRLFHEEEVRVEPGVAVSRGCRATSTIMRGFWHSFPKPNGRKWPMTTGSSRSIAPFVRGCSRPSRRDRDATDARPVDEARHACAEWLKPARV